MMQLKFFFILSRKSIFLLCLKSHYRPTMTSVKICSRSKFAVGEKFRRSKLPSVKNSVGQNDRRSKWPSVEMAGSQKLRRSKLLSVKIAVGQNGQKTWNRS
jgi:hypothetical protein